MANQDDYTPEERQLLTVDVSQVPDAILIAENAVNYHLKQQHIENFEKAYEEAQKELFNQPKRPRP